MWPDVSGTVGATTLTVEQLASHGHPYSAPKPVLNAQSANARTECKSQSATTGLVGGSQPHTHDLAGASEEANNLPPYYALAYIMRCA